MKELELETLTRHYEWTNELHQGSFQFQAIRHKVMSSMAYTSVIITK